MKFGLFGGAKSAGEGPAGDSHGYRKYIDYVLQAEELGFHSVFLVEHHFTGFGQVSASLNFLSYLAGRTQRIRLGTAVVVLPWHNPVLVAEQAATLDLLSNGRLDFGVGKGYRACRVLRLLHSAWRRRPSASTRRMAFIRKAWTSQGRFSHHGKRWHYDNIVVEPRPIQQPHPPFWMGAGSPSRSAARRARATICCSTRSRRSISIIERVAAFREDAARLGRPYDPGRSGSTRGLQIVRNEEERERAYALRTQSAEEHRRPGARPRRRALPAHRARCRRQPAERRRAAARHARGDHRAAEAARGRRRRERAAGRPDGRLGRRCAPSPRRSCRHFQMLQSPRPSPLPTLQWGEG